MNVAWKLLIGPASPTILDFSLFFMRVGIGILSVGHGYPKLVGGIASWRSVGSAMSVLGIRVFPAIWGLLAACVECFGGIAFILGLGTRSAALLLIFMMVVAFLMHYTQGDPFAVYSFPLTLIIVFIGFFIMGSGRFSVDHYLYQKATESTYPSAPGEL